MLPEVKRIHGRVARVLNSQEVAINKGTSDGVRLGMIFSILSTKGAEIKDPDTDKLLGSVEVEKTRVRVTIVEERLSVASTFRTIRTNVGGPGLGIVSLFEPPKWETHVETLKLEKAAKVELSESETFVRTGDPVVEWIDVNKHEQDPLPLTAS